MTYVRTIIGEHARGLRNSAYAVNLTYDTYRQHNWASEANPTLGCSIEISRDIYNTRKWFPLQGELASLTRKCCILLLIINQY